MHPLSHFISTVRTVISFHSNSLLCLYFTKCNVLEWHRGGHFEAFKKLRDWQHHQDSLTILAGTKLNQRAESLTWVWDLWGRAEALENKARCSLFTLCLLFAWVRLLNRQLITFARSERIKVTLWASGNNATSRKDVLLCRSQTRRPSS